jgi:acyl dehydratase
MVAGGVMKMRCFPPIPVTPEGDAMLYLEDLTPGRCFRSDTRTVEADEIKSFAAAYDPQPFHLDEEAAKATFFGGLAASGWLTAGITMRLLVGSVPIAGGIIGAGMDELRWPHPVRPGDLLLTESEVLEARPSRSRPTHGLVKLRTRTLNQDGREVMVLVSNQIVPLRPPDGG